MFFMNHQNAINMTFGGRKNQPIIIQEKWYYTAIEKRELNINKQRTSL